MCIMQKKFSLHHNGGIMYWRSFRVYSGLLRLSLGQSCLLFTYSDPELPFNGSGPEAYDASKDLTLLLVTLPLRLLLLLLSMAALVFAKNARRILAFLSASLWMSFSTWKSFWRLFFTASGQSSKHASCCQYRKVLYWREYSYSEHSNILRHRNLQSYSIFKTDHFERYYQTFWKNYGAILMTNLRQ